MGEHEKGMVIEQSFPMIEAGCRLGATFGERADNEQGMPLLLSRSHAQSFSMIAGGCRMSDTGREEETKNEQGMLLLHPCSHALDLPIIKGGCNYPTPV